MKYIAILFAALLPWYSIPTVQSPETQEIVYKINQHITKQQMAEIMAIEESKITDELMNDFYKAIDLFGLDTINIAYFLGQVGHESKSLKHTIELHDGSRYEWRQDLGNTYSGDGVLYAGGGFLQLTGRANYQNFYDYLKTKGIKDPKILSHGKHHVGKHYPWTSGVWWWSHNKMIEYCKMRPTVRQVSAKVNGKYWANGLQDRQVYSKRAFTVLNLSYPG